MDAINFLLTDLRNRIDYHRKENEITYAAAVGVLEMLKIELIHEAGEIVEEGEEWK